MTVAEIESLLKAADEREFEALSRSLAADERKGVVKAVEVARRRLAAERDERDRVDALYSFEQSLKDGASVIVGLDEVGRGSVAGPLAVCAVVLPEAPHIFGLNDSKQLSPERREEVADAVKGAALAWAVEYVEPAFIDGNGMAASLRKAFSGALAQVEASGVHADVVLVDGNPLHIDEREINVLKGDAKCASIAAASVVAKTERDALMRALASDFPQYGFDVNKGYASPQHIEAIKEYGISSVHRASFCKSFMQETLF